MSRFRLVLPLAVALVGLLAACGSGSAAPAANGTTASRTPGGAGPAGGGGTPTTDPCQLVTQQEASAVTGAAFSPGMRQDKAPFVTCVYGAGTKNVFRVSVVAGSVDQLHQIRDQNAAQLQAGAADGGGKVSTASVSGVGDEATVETVQVTLNGQVLSNSINMFVIKGGHGLILVDLVTGGNAPTTDALTAVARTAADRLPAA
jgi:hypothetical protein